MRVTVNIPPDVNKVAEKLAKQSGKSVAVLYEEAIEAHIKALTRQQALLAIDSVLGTAELNPEADATLQQLRRDDMQRL